MHPIICQIGPLPVYSYGLMVAAAFLVCSFWGERDARRIGLRAGVISDLVFWLAVGGILGARVFYVITHPQEFFPEDMIDVIMIQKGGLSFQGGLIAAVATGWIFVRRHGLSWLMMLDFCAPFAALGQAIGRIGCFFNGCCYGRHWDHGIFFPVHGDTLYPTQLFDAAGLLVIFVLLKFQRPLGSPPSQRGGRKAESILSPLFEKEGVRGSSEKGNRGVQAQGIIFAQYLILAPALRFVIEFYRGDHAVLLYAGLSLYQWVCLALFLSGFGLFLYLQRR